MVWMGPKTHTKTVKPTKITKIVETSGCTSKESREAEACIAWHENEIAILERKITGAKGKIKMAVQKKAAHERELKRLKGTQNKNHCVFCGLYGSW